MKAQVDTTSAELAVLPNLQMEVLLAYFLMLVLSMLGSQSDDYEKQETLEKYQ